jgi:hypothetical protein
MDRSAPAAFLSYARADDEHDKGTIRDLCERLSDEVYAQRGELVHIFIDRRDIRWGQNWEARINESLETATILIPVITPRYFRSDACRNELTKFLKRESELRRDDLILPIYYITTPQLESPRLHKGDEIAKELSKRQYVDWRKLRFQGVHSEAISRKIADLANLMNGTLDRSQASTQNLDMAALQAMLGDVEGQSGTLQSGTALLVGQDEVGQDERRFLINDDSTFVGRDPDCRVFLDGVAVSRRHAEIRRTDTGFVIRDLGSLNGTYVNGERVDESTLKNNDVVQFGKFKFRVFVRNK